MSEERFQTRYRAEAFVRSLQWRNDVNGERYRWTVRRTWWPFGKVVVSFDDDAPTCPKIPQGYGVDPGDCACGNCPEARS